MIRNRQSIMIGWDVTSFGPVLKTGLKLPFTPTHFKMKQISCVSQSVFDNQGLIILNSDLAENHVPYLAIVRDDEISSRMDTVFKINKNKINHSHCVFYLDTLANNPNLFGTSGAGAVQQTVGLEGGVGAGSLNLDMEILFCIEFLEIS